MPLYILSAALLNTQHEHNFCEGEYSHVLIVFFFFDDWISTKNKREKTQTIAIIFDRIFLGKNRQNAFGFNGRNFLGRLKLRWASFSRRAIHETAALPRIPFDAHFISNEIAFTHFAIDNMHRWTQLFREREYKYSTNVCIYALAYMPRRKKCRVRRFCVLCCCWCCWYGDWYRCFYDLFVYILKMKFHLNKKK